MSISGKPHISFPIERYTYIVNTTMNQTLAKLHGCKLAQVHHDEHKLRVSAPPKFATPETISAAKQYCERTGHRFFYESWLRQKMQGLGIQVCNTVKHRRRYDYTPD